MTSLLSALYVYISICAEIISVMLNKVLTTILVKISSSCYHISTAVQKPMLTTLYT